MRIAILNGPNLNLLGMRETGIYGDENLDSILDRLRSSFPGIELIHAQYNLEGDMVAGIQYWGIHAQGIVINPGGYTHTSVAIADALRSVPAPAVEVHLSHLHKREAYRRKSITAPACRGIISGFGPDSYRLGIEALIKILD